MSTNDLLPLPPAGHVSILEQAQARGEPNPVGATLGELRARGYDLKNVDGGAPESAVYRANEKSPTGFSITWPRHLIASPLSEQERGFFLAN